MKYDHGQHGFTTGKNTTARVHTWGPAAGCVALGSLSPRPSPGLTGRVAGPVTSRLCAQLSLLHSEVAGRITSVSMCKALQTLARCKL